MPSDIIAIHRTYLQCDAAQPGKVAKASVSKPRMVLGKNGGGAVRLAPIGDTGVLGSLRRHRDRARRHERLPGACRLGRAVDLRTWSRYSCRRRSGGSSSSPIMTHPALVCAPPRPPRGVCGPRAVRSRSRCHRRPARTSMTCCCAQARKPSRPRSMPQNCGMRTAQSSTNWNARSILRQQNRHGRAHRGHISAAERRRH